MSPVGLQVLSNRACVSVTFSSLRHDTGHHNLQAERFALAYVFNPWPAGSEADRKEWWKGLAEGRRPEAERSEEPERERDKPSRVSPSGICSSNQTPPLKSKSASVLHCPVTFLKLCL